MNTDAETCAACGGRGQVVDSRIRGTRKQRRRKCLKCGERWNTHEIRVGVDKKPLEPSDVQTLLYDVETIRQAAASLENLCRVILADRPARILGHLVDHDAEPEVASMPAPPSTRVHAS